MIVRKTWSRTKYDRYWDPVHRYRYEGWFLMGFIPLFITREEIR